MEKKPFWVSIIEHLSFQSWRLHFTNTLHQQYERDKFRLWYTVDCYVNEQGAEVENRDPFKMKVLKFLYHGKVTVFDNDSDQCSD
jgi:hypothetical protein